MSDHRPHISTLFRLPAEIRLQIYLLVIPSRVVFVQLKWAKNYAQDGFAYSSLEDDRSLQKIHDRVVFSRSIPSGAEIRVLGQVCRQMQQETTLLPFETFIWAFDTAFTLDRWVSMEDSIPTKRKQAIRTVAVPTPGPYRSSERVLVNLREVLLTGTAYSTITYFTNFAHAKDADLAITTLKKDKASGIWIKDGKRAQYAKDLFV